MAHFQDQLATIDFLAPDPVAERSGERGLQCLEGVGHRQRREMVWVRLILFCSWIKP